MTDLIGSAVGLLGVLAGGIGVAAINARSDRRKEAALDRQLVRQEETQERTQRRELGTEHQKWLREHRQTSYLALLVAADEAREATRTLLHKVRATATEREELAQAIADERAGAGSLVRSLHAVQLAGPDPVAEAAMTFTDRILSRRTAVAVAASIRRRGETTAPLSTEDGENLVQQLNEHKPQIVEAEYRFAVLARAALAALPQEN
ncbi:hypothetical protein [Streptomyces fildesensis]|uniref:hypothetical protein n=1 Tax=Streptomyces fildesensis TaxID=375757 RepID=UPI0018DF4F1E|nr:hypothetical protein [Streptomyces fildesensis]